MECSGLRKGGRRHSGGIMFRGTSLIRQIRNHHDVQECLAHKKPPTPLGPPQGSTHTPTAGSEGGAVSYERGTPVGWYDVHHSMGILCRLCVRVSAIERIWQMQDSHGHLMALDCRQMPWEGFRESRRCSRDTYPESYITEYT